MKHTAERECVCCVCCVWLEKKEKRKWKVYRVDCRDEVREALNVQICQERILCKSVECLHSSLLQGWTDNEISAEVRSPSLCMYCWLLLWTWVVGDYCYSYKYFLGVSCSRWEMLNFELVWEAIVLSEWVRSCTSTTCKLLKCEWRKKIHRREEKQKNRNCSTHKERN